VTAEGLGHRRGAIGLASFSKMCVRCVFTVSGDSSSSSAISRFVRPNASSCSTFQLPGGERLRPAVPLLDLGQLLGQGHHQVGSMTRLPLATSRTVWIRSSASRVFRTYPRAPARTDSTTNWRSSYAESITTSTSGNCSRMRRHVSTPSMPGMRRSISATSGSESAFSRSTSTWVPSSASSVTSMSPAISRY
jgi:hypothetical protein